MSQSQLPLHLRINPFSSDECKIFSQFVYEDDDPTDSDDSEDFNVCGRQEKNAGFGAGELLAAKLRELQT
jgi:hypothetical protein